jgi:hypothetical protein
MHYAYTLTYLFNSGDRRWRLAAATPTPEYVAPLGPQNNAHATHGGVHYSCVYESATSLSVYNCTKYLIVN